MIEFEDVRIAYKDKPVLDGVSLTIHDREFFLVRSLDTPFIKKDGD